MKNEVTYFPEFKQITTNRRSELSPEAREVSQKIISTFNLGIDDDMKIQCSSRELGEIARLLQKDVHNFGDGYWIDIWDGMAMECSITLEASCHFEAVAGALRPPID